AVTAIGFAVAWMRRAPEPPPVVRFQLVLPPTLQNASPPMISPDGRNVAFAADNGGQRMIWIRSMDALDPDRCPGPKASTGRSGRRTAGSSGSWPVAR